MRNSLFYNNSIQYHRGCHEDRVTKSTQSGMTKQWLKCQDLLSIKNLRVKVCITRLRPGSLWEPSGADPHARWCGLSEQLQIVRELSLIFCT